MKRFRPIIPYVGIAACCFVLLLRPKPYEPPAQPKGTTIYDTALAMLQEFVIECQDTNLGFAHPNDVLHARIDTTKGIAIYGLIRDSILNGKMPLDSQLIDLHRHLYPVYVGDSLRSTITFMQTVLGWKPVIFDDSNIMVTALNTMPHALVDSSFLKSIKLVETPSIQTSFVIATDQNGTKIYPSPELRRSLGRHYPVAPGANPNAPIASSIFVKAVRTMLQAPHVPQPHGRFGYRIH